MSKILSQLATEKEFIVPSRCAERKRRRSEYFVPIAHSARATERASVLVDFTGWLFRDGKAAISAEVAGILERLGSNAESWWCRIEKLSNGRLLGRFFAVNRQRLRDVARRLGVHHLANLGGCVAR
jgi:hypothetical protein